jgi:hypothetical protein
VDTPATAGVGVGNYQNHNSDPTFTAHGQLDRPSSCTVGNSSSTGVLELVGDGSGHCNATPLTESMRVGRGKGSMGTDRGKGLEFTALAEGTSDAGVGVKEGENKSSEPQIGYGVGGSFIRKGRKIVSQMKLENIDVV